MFERMEKLLQRPTLYQKMAVPFWDDDHISKQMLHAHLDPDRDGASRTLAFIERSVSWIAETVPAAGYPTLLDIGCGPGVYTERFAQHGFQVTGVDLSRRSIEYARDSARRSGLPISYHCQNYLSLQLERTFDFATMIYCDYGALSPDDRKVLLQTVHQRSRPGGRFLLDVFSTAAYDRFAEKKTWEAHPQGGFWTDAAHLEFGACYRYPGHVTLEQTAILTHGASATYYLWNTYYSVGSLVQEISCAGFKVCGVFGDVSGLPYQDDSPTIAILLEK